ncbi:MAG: RsbRD N-terminal domain-containing protein [Deltaproteobacteria bacterium]|nr:RsbRD N-terminal domain-containing protein [Deltaproteobacteria bacterium]
MKLAERLAAQRSAIVKKWFELVASTYPPDTARFLKSQKDPFSNPVGQATIGGLKASFDALLAGADAQVQAEALDPIIRIRAVQSFSPAQATAFILALKPLIREALGKELTGDGTYAELLEVESRIDEMLLVGFGIYLKCRETLFQLKVDLERNRICHAFERAGIVTLKPEEGAVPEPQ